MEEGEFEMEEGEEEESQLAFDQSKYEEEKVPSEGDESQSSSQRSTKVIEFDEDGNFLNMKDDDRSRASNQGDAEPLTLGMNELKPQAHQLRGTLVRGSTKAAPPRKRE